MARLTRAMRSAPSSPVPRIRRCTAASVSLSAVKGTAARTIAVGAPDPGSGVAT